MKDICHLVNESDIKLSDSILILSRPYCNALGPKEMEVLEYINIKTIRELLKLTNKEITDLCWCPRYRKNKILYARDIVEQAFESKHSKINNRKNTCEHLSSQSKTHDYKLSDKIQVLWSDKLLGRREVEALWYINIKTIRELLKLKDQEITSYLYCFPKNTKKMILSVRELLKNKYFIEYSKDIPSKLEMKKYDKSHGPQMEQVNNASPLNELYLWLKEK